jgi:hypothetical protein
MCLDKPSYLKKQELAFGAGDTVKTMTLENLARGILAEIDIQIPVWTNNPGCVVTLERSDGTIAWSGASLSKGAGITYTAQFPERIIQGSEVLKATLSLAPGGTGGSVWISPFIK